MQLHLLPVFLFFLISKSQCIVPSQVLHKKAASKCARTTIDSECAAISSRTVGLSRRTLVASLLTLPVAAAAAASASAAPTTIQRSNNDNVGGNESSSILQESISGLVAGSTLTLTKSLVKYPLDTATVRLQMPGSTYSITRPAALLEGAYRGIAAPLIANIPAGAVFFAVKDATKSLLRQASLPVPPILQTCVAVGLAQLPYWIVRNPSEVVKTRQQAGMDGFGEGVTTWQAYDRVRLDALRSVVPRNGTNVGGVVDFRADKLQVTANAFYVGYWENILYAYPADVVKFVCYDLLTSGRKNALSPVEGAWAGALSTAFAQLITTPLDVVRNRVMCQAGTSDATSGGAASEGVDVSNPYIASLVKLAKEEGLAGLFAGATPRVSKAFLSGAIQFATYEETKQTVLGLLLKN